MKVAILGYDSEGRSSYDYYAAAGHELTILDQDSGKVVPDGASSVLGDGYLNDLGRFDLIVRTAGLPPAKIFAANPGLSPDKITTQINEFFRVCPTRNIIGVTGTKGKGTTSTLIFQMLTASGLRAHLAGNIGIPVLNLLPNLTADDWVVLELSSFQLTDARYSPIIAVCLMVVPEHLNWHIDEADYLAAKAQLFAHQQPSDIAIYYADSLRSQQIVSVSPAKHLPYGRLPGATVDGHTISISGQTICKNDELKLLGSHNWQNVCAALTTVWCVIQNVEACRQVLTSFSGLKHRLELVRSLNGVDYYDDSFGTTPETAIVALQAFRQPKVVILGGSDKGADYDELARTVKNSNVRQVLLIGEQAGRIQSALEAARFQDFMPGGTTMSAIVSTARDVAQPGDVVLLSTGCASFDMFLNYKDRAAQFSAAVRALA